MENGKTVLITGANGAIGRSLCDVFHQNGWHVLGTDVTEEQKARCEAWVAMDLARLCKDDGYHDDRIKRLKGHLPNGRLHVLINNAAVQITNTVDRQTVAQWQQTFQVNVMAPFLLIKAFYETMSRCRGVVINIGSIHARLTKPGFTAYAASKAALAQMTRSLAVELGRRVRVNAIAPAAVDTPMLAEGFKGNESALQELIDFHPTGAIGTPEQVAQAALFLSRDDVPFLNGAVLALDGGISARLHDPV